MNQNILNNDPLFNALKDRLENYSSELNPEELSQLWNNVKNGINPASPLQSLPSKIFSFKSIGVVLVSAVAIITTLTVINNNKKTDVKQSIISDKIIEQPISQEPGLIENTVSKIENNIEKSNTVTSTDQYTETGFNSQKNNIIGSDNENNNIIIQQQDNLSNKYKESGLGFEIKFSDTIICAGDEIKINSSVVSDEFLITIIFPDKQINNFSGSTSYRFVQPGEYIVLIIINKNNKIVKKYQKIHVQSNPKASFTIFKNNLEIEIKNYSNDASRYDWNFGDGSFSDKINPRHTYKNNGIYLIKLTAENRYGCKNTEQQEIYVVSNEPDNQAIPNYFTPNGDGTNDYYYITLSDIESFEIKIMDRNGNTVFTSKDIEEKWDGTDRSTGRECLSGQYFYVINYKQIGNMPVTKTGAIYLNRK